MRSKLRRLMGETDGVGAVFGRECDLIFLDNGDSCSYREEGEYEVVSKRNDVLTLIGVQLIR